MPVDLYVGGAEHAVLHLLYSRFWHKVLFDRGHVSTLEPFNRLVNQGMILGEAEITGYKTAAGAWVSVRNVAEGPPDGPGKIDRRTGEAVTAVSVPQGEAAKQGNDFVLAADPAIVVESRAYKMSKSRGNVINPDQVVDEYGADALRLYEMFMGPLEATKPWSMSGVEGVSRFLARVWRMIADERSEEIQLNPAVQDVEPTPEQLRLLHRTIQAVTKDLQSLGFNTAISRLMEFVNSVGGVEPRPKSMMEKFVLLLSPLAPHLAEECWEILGHEKTLAYEPWPEFDPTLLVEATVDIPVQVNGKLRSQVTIQRGSAEEAALAVARGDAKVAGYLEGQSIVKVIFVPDRMLNIVVKKA
jgi:leucyl-tRNA synthetase